MTLTVQTPDTRALERDYILGVLLGEFLGLPWRRVPSERRDVRISLEGAHGELRLPDELLSVPADDWLTVASMPLRPLVQWDTRDLADDITLVESVLPVIYGDREPGVKRENESIALPVDIFGSAFFMLSRYEELVTPDRDEHDRFAAWASMAYQEGFLERPLVDEYVEILWEAMRSLWPGIERRWSKASTQVTCDVDSPFCFDGSLKKTVRRVGGDLLKRRSPSNAARTVVGAWFARKGDYHLDPHRNGLQYIMDVNEQADRSVAFYFIAEKTDPRLDKPVSLDDPRMRHLLQEIHARGHEIGLHPGYNTFRHPDAMARSVKTLRRVMAEEGIDQEKIGGRQHFLRWETAITPRLWDENGLDYDSTLNYADRPGFRCGTSREYPLYDLKKGCALRVRERPLIVMECSVIAKRYMALGYGDEALAVMERCRDISHRFGGNFTLLWHNSHLDSAADHRFFRRLVD
ncbi:MarR family transcriptional regulator [Spiribacter aquaticus]|uniref:MarR family transcriptional regulator n=1 Tax=Spiribacter aquaticus TaxID=1935996 RepID=A0A557RNF8_9GAMM|nr:MULTISPECIES: polysaccharide deacetylase family protein [Spiribacter]KAF0279732.1 MarR family transcriptional regulator [Spiribacter roseus]TVO66710.1 MarR family transcriptional regulator [Spiribacter aquaticus]